MLNKNKALVVLSGGQDSTTCLFWALQEFPQVSAICFDYGQTHAIEIESAKTVAKMAGVPLEIVKVPGMLVSASPLTDPNAKLDRYSDFASMEAEVGDKVEKTFVPMRNTFFLTVAANRAVGMGAGTLVTGVCQQDNANYPDCTEKFIVLLKYAFNQSLGCEYGSKDECLHIATPLMHLSKADTCQLAMTLPGCWEALAYSHTSYDGKYPPNDPNHSNLLRAQGFLEANLADPLVVRAWKEGLMELPETPNYDKTRRDGK